MSPSDKKHALVVYACRKQDQNAREKFTSFWNSYNKHVAGYDHDLLIIKKGFEKTDSFWNSLERQIAHLSFDLKEYPDRNYLSGYYRTVIEENPEKYILFLTSSCELHSDHWLKKMMQHASPNNLLGTCAAFESPADGYIRRQKEIPPLTLKNILRCSRKTRKKWINRFLGRPQTIEHHPVFSYDYFLPFPNPGIRTHAFMVPPGILNRIGFYPKTECCIAKEMEFVFESGIIGLSKQALLAGMKLLVVGADGEAYPMEKWYESNTFRTKIQENMLIGDHHTRNYAEASPEMKKKYEEISYGGGNVDMQETHDIISKLDMTTFESVFYKLMNVIKSQ